jgi:hypothetical protein
LSGLAFNGLPDNQHAIFSVPTNDPAGIGRETGMSPLPLFEIDGRQTPSFTLSVV